MYRWPIRLVADGEDAEPLWLEVPPRGAAFTLTCLMHLGHPVHLALIDAYLRGSVPFPPGASLGWDSRAVLANLVGPLALLYTGGYERVSLADVLLLPPGRQEAGHSRLVVRAAHLACASARSRHTADVARAMRAGPAWHHVVSIVPTQDELRRRRLGGAHPVAVAVISEEPREQPTEEPSGRADERDDGPMPGGRDGRATSRSGDSGEVARDVVQRLMGDLGQPSHVSVGLVWEGSPTEASLTTEVDGGHTVRLHPGRKDDLESPLSGMESAAWATLEALIEMPIEERRSEPIALRLVGPRRTTELAIGRSLVLPRNRRVFAAWLGSDRRVVIRLTAEGTPTG